MASWGSFEEQQPELAARVRALFDSARHKTIATLRADGSPRISGIETEFADGELRFGSMTGSRKGADLARDPRFALHGPSVDPIEGQESDWPGEAKISGRAVRVEPDAGAAAGDGDSGDGDPGDAYVADIGEVVLTKLDPAATKLVIELWTPDGGHRRFERE